MLCIWEDLWNIFLSLTFLKPKQFLELGYSAEMAVRSFEGPSISIAHRPATQIIRQPTERCSGQSSPPPHTQYPPIHPHPSSPSSLAVHNWDNLKASALYRAGKIRLPCAKLFLQCWKKTVDISLPLHSHINEKKSMRLWSLRNLYWCRDHGWILERRGRKLGRSSADFYSKNI